VCVCVCKALTDTHLCVYPEVHEDVIEDELLDVKVHHRVAVKRALEAPAQRLDARDVVPNVRVTARGSSDACRCRPEHEPRRIASRWTQARPARATLERAVIHHYRRRTGLEALPLQREYGVRRALIILKSVNSAVIIHVEHSKRQHTRAVNPLFFVTSDGCLFCVLCSLLTPGVRGHSERSLFISHFKTTFTVSNTKVINCRFNVAIVSSLM